MRSPSTRAQLFLLLLAIAASACMGDDQARGAGPGSTAARGPAARAATAMPAVATVPTSTLTLAERAADDTLYDAAAARAWRFVDRNYVPLTGLVRPFDHYAMSTVWDIASGLAALFAATELGLLPRAEYDARIARALATLHALPLFDDVGFNKEYRVSDGAPIDVERRPGRRGYGISATDHGRLLVILRAIADAQPQHRAAVERVVARLDLDAFENDGYLVGRQLSRRTGRTREFQEGRIGYEQYAARGFALWGLTAARALDITAHRAPRFVEGIEVPADQRGADRLTGEPFFLLGIEAGWTPAERAAAEAVLRAQEARYARSGQLTMVSEDAIDRAPDYFYYYGVLTRHGPFTIDVQRPNVRVDGPRWLSAKAAFAWHALVPRAYTRRVVDTVAAKAVAAGDVWGSGVFADGRPTGNANLNTAAVILEAALYRRVGRPLIFHRSGAGAGAGAPAPAPADTAAAGGAATRS